jgi:peptidoglycan biosynthesis protein MviN/MurJ (putative lipid II flippase)
MMYGILVMVLTFAAIVAFIFIVKASHEALETLNELYVDTKIDEHVERKALLFIPYVLLFLWVALLRIVLFAGAYFAVVSFAKSIRNWWHSDK